MSQPNTEYLTKKESMLGDGLQSLFGTGDLVDELDQKLGLTNLSINLLIPNPYQPRKIFTPEALQELSQSIKANGILQPILVRLSGTKDSYDHTLYEIIAGERRWRAAKLANLTKVPVIIKEVDNKQALIDALLENIQRDDLNALEEAQSYNQLLEEFRYTQEQLSKIIGKSRSYIANILRLLRLPDNLKNALTNGNITVGHARALLNCTDQNVILQKIISENLNVRQTENLVYHKSNQPDSSEQSKSVNKLATSQSPIVDTNQDISLIEQEVSRILNMKAKISIKSDNSGEVTLYFTNLMELDNFMGKLS